MTSFLMIVRSQPHPGKDADFNQWYEDQHLGDLMRIPGIVSARRYEVVSGVEGWDGAYIGIYEIEAESTDVIDAELARRRNTPEMRTNPDAVDSSFTLKIMAKPIGTPRP